MATPINIPKLGVAITEATISEWLVTDGDEVTEGQDLYVLATDKVETTIEAPASGIVRILAVVDETLDVGTLIARID